MDILGQFRTVAVRHSTQFLLFLAKVVFNPSLKGFYYNKYNCFDYKSQYKTKDFSCSCFITKISCVAFGRRKRPLVISLLKFKTLLSILKYRPKIIFK